MDGIILEHVNKKLKGKPVLTDINLRLERGSIYAFIGRNASGKTMLFRAIAGLILPDSGRVEVFGQKISEQRIFPASMGLIIETVGLWKNLTGFENLALLAGIQRVASTEDIRNALRRVGLDPDDTRKYRAFSMGMKQKLALAQAVMEKPELLILDEPTNGMDEEAVSLFQALIAEEKARGATCLIATHQREDIQGLCDRTYAMREGRCVEQSKEELS